MLNAKKILAPTDFSEQSDLALDYAIGMANGCDGEAEIDVIHVIEPAVYPTEWGFSHPGFSSLEQELEAASKLELDKIAKKLLEAGIKNKISVLIGRASDKIIEYANENCIDLIVIAAYGKSGIEHLLFGSTTDRVLRKAPCPALVFKKKKKCKKEN